MAYPGLTYIGSGKISGLYGLNETIHDQKSIGLQHLYADDYENDLIYCAVSVLTADNTCYYGDRIKPKLGHPRKQRSKNSFNKHGFVFVDEFDYEDFRKTDCAYCVDEYQLTFTSEVVNKSEQVHEVQLSALMVTAAGDATLIREQNVVEIQLRGKRIQLRGFDDDLLYRLSIESPSGFMYHGIQDILYDDNLWDGNECHLSGNVALSVSKAVVLDPGESYQMNWMLDFSNDDSLRRLSAYKDQSVAYEFWKEWLEQSRQDIDKQVHVNLIALKAANMKGVIPADLTGHYFASDDIAFYVRDALHCAKAFMFCGYHEECREIVDLVMDLKRKENHELYQRYNSRLIPDEGANNNVFSQIDVIGYLLSVVVDFYELTSELLVGLDDLMREVEILDNVDTKNGLYGPEGGVNEGVYGPAFITSTNIFIAAGLKRLMDLMERMDKERLHKEPAGRDHGYRASVGKKFESLQSAINETFLEEGYYGYGYVGYHDQLIKRYDTPQLFGAGLGYPMDECYRKNFETLTDIATYFDYGYGYSEQQYHDGPWLFNTCYAAQNALLLDDTQLHDKIIEWIEKHRNDYGLLPEAVDARNENNSFINPLMWANAEYLCAKQAAIIKQLRGGEGYVD